jgi:hypothetical protein
MIALLYLTGEAGEYLMVLCVSQQYQDVRRGKSIKYSPCFLSFVFFKMKNIDAWP